MIRMTTTTAIRRTTDTCDGAGDMIDDSREAVTPEFFAGARNLDGTIAELSAHDADSFSIARPSAAEFQAPSELETLRYNATLIAGAAQGLHDTGKRLGLTHTPNISGGVKDPEIDTDTETLMQNGEGARTSTWVAVMRKIQKSWKSSTESERVAITANLLRLNEMLEREGHKPLRIGGINAPASYRGAAMAVAETVRVVPVITNARKASHSKPAGKFRGKTPSHRPARPARTTTPTAT